MNLGHDYVVVVVAAVAAVHQLQRVQTGHMTNGVAGRPKSHTRFRSL